MRLSPGLYWTHFEISWILIYLAIKNAWDYFRLNYVFLFIYVCIYLFIYYIWRGGEAYFRPHLQLSNLCPYCTSLSLFPSDMWED